MSDTIQAPAPAAKKRVPGPVIFTAILDFISVSLLGMVCLFALVALIFGNVLGLYDFVSREMNQYMSAPNYSYGVTFLLGMILAGCLSFVLFFVLLGIGLLKGKKTAWYVQVVLCVLGLLAFPFGTALNGVLLFLFFGRPIRDFFDV